MSSVKALGLGALLVLSTGCGVSSWVTAPESKYPISMSSGVRDAQGDLVPEGRKTVVGRYEQHYKACSMLWRIISFTGDKDISEDVNTAVADAKGDAVTDLSVESSATVWTLLTLIGIFPDCGQVRLQGNIVKVTPVAPKPVPVAPKPVPVPVPALAPATAPATAPTPEPPTAS